MRGRRRVGAIYGDDDVKKTLKAMRGVDYGDWLRVLKGARCPDPAPVDVTFAYKKPGPKLFQNEANARRQIAFDIGNEAGKCGQGTRRALRDAS